jgi:hypothetical protein
MAAAGRGDDCVKRCFQRPAERTVAFEDLDVAITEPLHSLPGKFNQLMMPLDRDDLPSDLADDGGRVARPGTDLEHLVARSYPCCVNRQCDDIGLADGLAAFDRQGGVLVCVTCIIGADELLARHGPESREQLWIVQTPSGDLPFDHAIAKGGEVRHRLPPWFELLGLPARSC